MPRHSFKTIFIICFSLGVAGIASLFASADLPETNATHALQTTPAAPHDATAAAIRSILVDETAFEAPPASLSHTLRLFYASRRFRPVWSDTQQMLPTADAYRRLLDGIADEGLDPDRPAYGRKRIDTLMAQETEGKPDRLARLDLLLTKSFFALGHDLHFGVAYGADLNATHEYGNTPVDMGRVLDHAAASGEIGVSLLSLTPKHPEYRRLIAALAFYRTLAEEDGWSTNAADYAKDDAVRKRLVASGDLNESNDTATPEMLEAALKRFQQRFGITADGVVGPVTSAKMAVAPGKLAETIRLNIERWKWLPPHEDGPYIIVNIPGFELKVMRAGETALKTRAIVGRRERETPTFASKLRYIVFNPYWHIPETILKEDLIPKLQADPHYLAARDIKVFAAGDGDGRHPIDPDTIAWKQWGDADMQRYVFRMDPGPDNPLGYIKFIFPNDYDVYVHDTPSHALFKKSSATFSSGCIRIRKPVELAYFLLAQENPEMTYKDILTPILSGETSWVRLKNPPDIYITYQTAAVGEDGLVRFYDDIYGYDRKLENYLNKN